MQREARPDEELASDDVERIVDEVRRKGGRPSLTDRGVPPTVNVRLPKDLRARLDRVAAKQGRRTSEVTRAALEEYLFKP